MAETEPKRERWFRLTHSLSAKLNLLLLGAMLVIFALLGYLNVRLHRQHLEQNTLQAAERISDVIKQGTTDYMLRNDRSGLYQSIQTMAAEPGIYKIRIFDQDGRITYTTTPSEQNHVVDKTGEACYGCHAQSQPLTRLNRPDRFRIYRNGDSHRILGIITPIENQPSCSNAACHAHPASQQILGVLDTNLSLAKADVQLAESSRRMIAYTACGLVLIAVVSWFLKCHYLAAFTAALLNNQPMGFYRPATLVKDAQRHGLKMLPIDVTRSDWNCTLEPVYSQKPDVILSPSPDGRMISRDSVHTGDATEIAVRVGLRYARGLREEAAQGIVQQRRLAPFTSIRDLVHRVPQLRKDELVTLAEIGALNTVSSSLPDGRSISRPAIEKPSGPLNSCSKPETRNSKLLLHRRDALWQVERAVRLSGPLLDQYPEQDSKSPLQPMNDEERLVADFRGTGMTVGPHPMAYHREKMNALGIRRANELTQIPDGKYLRIGGCVIARQRPGTAKGFVFLSLEDETGVANA